MRDAVKTGFNGPEEGGFAPNMAVVTADCAQFVCEIPYGGTDSNGAIRDQIFRQKIAVTKTSRKSRPFPKRLRQTARKGLLPHAPMNYRRSAQLNP